MIRREYSLDMARRQAQRCNGWIVECRHDGYLVMDVETDLRRHLMALGMTEEQLPAVLARRPRGQGEPIVVGDR